MEPQSATRGFYAMTRGWMQHAALSGGSFCKRAAWCWLIEEAAYKPTQVNVGGQVIELRRGQFSHSLRFIARAWNWLPDRVRRFLLMLRDHDMIAVESATGAATAQLVITIC